MPGALLLRIQQWVTFPLDGLEQAIDTSESELCSHLHWYLEMDEDGHDVLAERFLGCKILHNDSKGCETCVSFLQCPSCKK